MDPVEFQCSGSETRAELQVSYLLGTVRVALRRCFLVTFQPASSSRGITVESPTLTSAASIVLSTTHHTMNEEGDIPEGSSGTFAAPIFDVSAQGMSGIQPHIVTESSVDLRDAMSPGGTENQAPISAAEDLTTVTRKLEEASISSTVISDERPTSQANNLNGCLYASVRDPTSPDNNPKDDLLESLDEIATSLTFDNVAISSRDPADCPP
jgi:hypothetical protein